MFTRVAAVGRRRLYGRRLGSGELEPTGGDADASPVPGVAARLGCDGVVVAGLLAGDVVSGGSGGNSAVEFNSSWVGG